MASSTSYKQLGDSWCELNMHLKSVYRALFPKRIQLKGFKLGYGLPRTLVVSHLDNLMRQKAQREEDPYVVKVQPRMRSPEKGAL